ncbi:MULTISPECIES: hypothetical protein [Lactobacillus]|uniref:Uncharacterized protein n=1 Tax=Lactobacillus xujianguonis TaxID=2495899 RepID=A0A437SSE6_9LACO|nr:MULTISPECIES: hypothetical protein [Lactobacillus]RVU69840.1 hypothetical protein EJK17_10975 [Lactobacillus xujianguonis]RVU77449.1 hypothetical protein EJK20_01430 [Lactobacillus xujianguonis]
MNDFIKVLLTIITTGGLGMVNYTIAESLNAVDSTLRNTNREKSISAILTIIDLLIYLTIDIALRNCIHNTFAEIIAALLTVIISIILSIKFSKKINELFYKNINGERNKNDLISLDSGTPWQAVMLSENKFQQAYIYSLEHKPIGFGWVQYVSNDSDSNYSLSLVPFTDDAGSPQPEYDKITQKIQSKEYKDKHIVQQYIDLKEKFIIITSIEKD